MALIISLVGCAPNIAPKPPDIDFIYEIDTVRSVCVPYPVISKMPFKIGEPTSAIPMSECDGSVSVPYEDFQKIIKYIEEMQQFALDRKRCFKK